MLFKTLIRYRFDGKLLNLRRLQTKSKVQTDVVDKLLYADDLAENAKSEEKMQGAVDRMSKACDNFQLTINTKKTEVVHQPAPGKQYSEPTISHSIDSLYSTNSVNVYVPSDNQQFRYNIARGWEVF